MLKDIPVPPETKEDILRLKIFKENRDNGMSIDSAINSLRGLVSRILNTRDIPYPDAYWQAYLDTLEAAIKDEREEHVFIAIDNFVKGKRKGYDMAKSEVVSPPLPKTNQERFNTYKGALRTYEYETGNIVYDKESFEKFCKWLYDKRCEDDCPFYRIVEGEGECRPRCTNPCGHCFDASEEAN